MTRNVFPEPVAPNKRTEVGLGSPTSFHTSPVFSENLRRSESFLVAVPNISPMSSSEVPSNEREFRDPSTSEESSGSRETVVEGVR